MWFKLNTTFTQSLGTLSELSNSWSITRNLTNYSTTSTTTSVAKNGTYSATFTLNAGCTYSSHSVTMGGATVSSASTASATAYKYDSSTHTITFSNFKVTGALVITAVATGASSGGSGGGNNIPGYGENFTNFSFEAGTLTTSGDTNTSTEHDTTRFRMVDYIEFPETSYIRVTPPAGYVWAVHERDKTTNTQIYYSPAWCEESVLFVKPNCKYCFKGKKADNSNISLADMANFTITRLQESDAVNNTYTVGWKQGGFTNGTYTEDSTFCRTDKFKLQNHGIISVDSNNQYIQIWTQSTLAQGGTQGPQITSGWFSDDGVFQVDAGIYCIALTNSDVKATRTDITPEEVATVITIKEFGT